MNDIFDLLKNMDRLETRKNYWLDEDNEAFYVSWEVPGFSKDDFDISYQDMTLTVKGSCDFRGLKKEFHQSVSIPSTVDPESIKANLERGVLTIGLRKTSSHQPRQIPIS